MNLKRKIQNLAQNKTSGASSLTREVLDILHCCLETRGDLEVIAREVIQAQPAMASIFNAVDRVLGAVRQGKTPSFALAPLSFPPSLFSRFNKGEILLTLSCSASVATFIQHLHTKTTVRKVIICASAPHGEGRELPKLLPEIPTQIIDDNAALSFIPHVGAILLGIDALFPDTFVNKIGSLALCLGGAHFGIRCFAIAQTDKFLPVSNFPLAQKELFFEKIPLPLLTQILTDQGGFSPSALPPFPPLQCPDLLETIRKLA